MARRIRRRSVLSDSLENLDLRTSLRHIYAARGIKKQSELDLDLHNLARPSTLMGAHQAACLLADHIRDNSKILVIGDFDADGATGTALAVRILAICGALDVEYIVPNRFDFGYGLTPEIVEVAKGKTPKLIITVDNGISSLDGVALARNLGIDVIITDHHLPGPSLPPANVIVNPNQPGCEFASKNLAGVGVIFYVMLALRSELRDRQWFTFNEISEPNLASFLDLVAVGTIADVVTLDYNNRILVQGGLRLMRSGRACPGISALIESAGRNYKYIVAADLGFGVAPRLNSAGRLDDMSIGIDCLLASDVLTASKLSNHLDRLNRSRTKLSSDMTATALAAVRDIEFEGSGNIPGAIVLYDSNWHQGVTGIIAGRIKERFCRPTIVFADSGEDLIKGSARSIEGIHIRDVLEVVAVKNENLLAKFGGHAMAAGLSLYRKDLDRFRSSFRTEVERILNDFTPEDCFESDGEFDPNWFTLEEIQAISMAGPWGNGFPAPIFDGHFQVLSKRIVGSKHIKLVLSAPNFPYPLDAIAFNVDFDDWLFESTVEIEIVYRLEINIYRGEKSIQAIVEHLVGIN